MRPPPSLRGASALTCEQYGRAPVLINGRAFTGSSLTATPVYLPCVFCYMIAPRTTHGKRQPMLKHLKRFVKDESGAAAIEYGLITSGVSVAIIPGVRDVGTKLVAIFTAIQSAL